jgi:hypothetical protein
VTLNRRVWDGTQPIVNPGFGARSIGGMALIQVGCELWTDPDARKSSHEEGVGGIVLEITSDIDDEGTVNRAFRCYDYLAAWHQAFRTIPENQVLRDSIEAVDPARLVRTCRRFWRELAKHQTSMLDTSEARLAADAQRLVNTLMGGRW